MAALGIGDFGIDIKMFNARLQKASHINGRIPKMRRRK